MSNEICIQLRYTPIGILDILFFLNMITIILPSAVAIPKQELELLRL